jgi:hypothetical protein
VVVCFFLLLLKYQLLLLVLYIDTTSPYLYIASFGIPQSLTVPVDTTMKSPTPSPSYPAEATSTADGDDNSLRPRPRVTLVPRRPSSYVDTARFLPRDPVPPISSTHQSPLQPSALFRLPAVPECEEYSQDKASFPLPLLKLAELISNRPQRLDPSV